MTMLECVRLQELTSFFLEVHPLFIFIDTTTDGFILGVHVESALALHVQSDSSYLTMRSYRIWPSSSLASMSSSVKSLRNPCGVLSFHEISQSGNLEIFTASRVVVFSI